MASTYTPLGIELQATGENAGTWGTKTNTNLQIVEQITGGYIAKSIAGGAQTTALAVSDGSTGAELAHRVIEFTGTITGNQIVTIPLDVENFFILKNSTSGAYTVQFKYASGSGATVTFSSTQKSTKIINLKQERMFLRKNSLRIMKIKIRHSTEYISGDFLQGTFNFDFVSQSIQIQTHRPIHTETKNIKLRIQNKIKPGPILFYFS